ncbi:MAG: PilT/PilU family type 4a pilus ATPase [Deltaproteobacteria bacterium]|nr:PilT/PilU family type 4a pilus ATPase [Deltaproteobacteria bacterium]
MARLDTFLKLVVEQHASDLHFHAGNPPIVRHDGDIIKLPFRVLSDSEAERFIYEIMTDEQKKAFLENHDLDMIYVIDGVGRFRVNVFLQSHGPSAVFRVIPQRLPTVEELMLPPMVKKLAQLNNGLILVTGPTGAGKTTTLAAIVNYINTSFQKHIITIEDPIEFVHEPINSVITQRQIGYHAESFATALRSALRESPDVLVVGEMRDLETVQLALQAAETGVLVFATLHTNSAAKSIDRIIDVMPEESRDQTRGVLSVLLRGVMAQHLCKRASGEGRIAVMELLVQNWAVSNMIRENKIHMLDSYLLSASLAETGCQSLDSCALQFIREGLITLEDGLKIANDPLRLKELASEFYEVEED